MRPDTQYLDSTLSFGPEFRFVLSLCRTAGPLLDADPDRLVKSKLNWDEVLRIGSVQGVFPLMWKQLRQSHLGSRVPESAAEVLRATAEASARRNLYLSKRLIDILEALGKHGITAVPFKGPALASRLYGDLALRQSSDLDLLVQQRDLSAALQVLANIGLRSDCELSPRRYRAMLKRECELPLLGADGISVDLHWNLMARYFCIPVTVDCFWDRLVITRFAGTTIQDLAPEDLLVCLALHARKHYWAKLIWISDIARLITQTPDMNWPLTIDRCQELRARRILLLTLYLCNQLFGIELAQQVSRAIRDDGHIKDLAAWSTRNLEIGLESYDSGLRNYLLSLRTREYWRDRVGQVFLHTVTPGIAEWRAAWTPCWMDIPLHLIRMGTKAAGFGFSRSTG